MFFRRLGRGRGSRPVRHKALPERLHASRQRAERVRRFGADGGIVQCLLQSLHVQEALEKWQRVLGEDPSWSAESFEKWYKFWNIRDEDSAKLMEGIYKTGVLGMDAKPSQ